jgi:hypothetical protein
VDPDLSPASDPLSGFGYDLRTNTNGTRKFRF